MNYDDPNFWAPRRCLREPIPEIFEAAELLSSAVDAHLKNDRTHAGRLIAEANMPSLWEWYHSIMGQESREVHRQREVAGTPPKLSSADRDPKSEPTREEKWALIARDGYRCRFCGIPVVRREIRDAMRYRYPDALPWPTVGKGCDQRKHTAFLCMTLTHDHVLPHSRGGLTNLDNLVITCWPCNFGKAGIKAWTLEQVGLMNPLENPPEHAALKIEWDGLQRFVNDRR